MRYYGVCRYRSDGSYTFEHVLRDHGQFLLFVEWSDADKAGDVYSLERMGCHTVVAAFHVSGTFICVVNEDPS